MDVDHGNIQAMEDRCGNDNRKSSNKCSYYGTYTYKYHSKYGVEIKETCTIIF